MRALHNDLESLSLGLAGHCFNHGKLKCKIQLVLIFHKCCRWFYNVNFTAIGATATILSIFLVKYYFILYKVKRVCINVVTGLQNWYAFFFGKKYWYAVKRLKRTAQPNTLSWKGWASWQPNFRYKILSGHEP